MPGTQTRFSPLWIDQPDAMETLSVRESSGEINATLGERLRHLIEHGYTIIPNAISHELADTLIAEMDGVTQNPDKFIARRARAAYTHPTADVVKDPTFRIIDFHVNSEHATGAIYCDAISELLHAAFDQAANAFQCLTFVHGSQQALHQDGAYVVVSEPLKFLASWIALEDVTEGSGELMYYVGSHRLDDFLFGDEKDSKAWHPERHGKPAHQEFLKSIVERSKSMGLPLERFLPKKGDALIWASDLVHGGARMKNDNTRKSIVTHYCPVDVNPNFRNFTDYFHLREVADGGFISSRHYDLRPKGRWFRKQEKLLNPSFMGHN